mmetsp:Transcript_18022/g.45480  ORF Transcript_18022/g.45480 Transcript_18022/m.45480 type:complete len:379 (+) Transcript_18022:30-1166(+)
MAVPTGATNTVHVALPAGADLAATKIAFERFGEVARVDRLREEEPPKVAVVFFDVRAAAGATEALGSAYCTRGPQIGARTVRLAGDAKFDSEDFAGISDVQTDTAQDGTYILEFFDIRDAQRYRASQGKVAMESINNFALPPGLGPVGMARPPGLPGPPGLEEEGSETAYQCQVTISGLPNKLLSEPMMEAILQQAGLDSAAAGFKTKPGKPCGEATVTFSCPIAAERCVTHFMGCQWDQSGTAVKTKVVELGSKDKQTAKQGFDDAFACQYMMDMAALGLDPSFFAALPHGGILADAAAATTFGGQAPSLSALSAEASMFVPAARRSDGKVAKGRRRKTSALSEKCIGSDTSTEVGESDAEDEKGGPKITTPISVLL